MRFLVIITIGLFLFFPFKMYSQEFSRDTIEITVQEAEKIFLEKNLVLLAERCNVDAAKAMIIQAKLFINPTFAVEQGVYNPNTKKWGDYSKTGETAVQLSKVFLMAGKRNKKIKLEKTNSQRSEYLFFDIMRTMKYTLRTDFNNIFFLQQNINVYKSEILSLKKIISVFEIQYQKGFVSLKELMRLKSALFTLESEQLSYRQQMAEIQSELSVMLQFQNKFLIAQLDTSIVNNIKTDSFQLSVLIDSASANRFDLKAAESTVQYDEINLRYQKAMSVPDITLSAGWDRQGSYINNYNFLSLQFDIPMFNRNQGYIKAAKYHLDNSKYMLDNYKLQVQQDVTKSYSKIIDNEEIYKRFDNHFQNDFNKLVHEILLNYEKRNLSLLEFLDFYDAYKQNTVQYNSLQNYRINAFEELSFSVGKQIFNY